MHVQVVVGHVSYSICYLEIDSPDQSNFASYAPCALYIVYKLLLYTHSLIVIAPDDCP